MAKAKKNIMMTADPKESAKKFKELDGYIHSVAASFPGDQKGVLMGVLHKVQSVFGYIPREAMDFVSSRLSIPSAHIYGMATFYNFFSLKPKPRFKICTC